MSRRRILVTGASKGIGKAVYELLSGSEEYDVLAPPRDEMDLGSADSIDRYMREHGEIDILVNNAGINLLRPVNAIDERSISEMMAVNLEAPLRLITRVVPGMQQKRFGRIINISSIWGVRSKELRTLYSMTKFGLNGITKALARELGPYNVLINSVCPGFTNTELTQQNLPPAEQDEIRKTIPLGRFAEPGEIARFIRFLISEENTYLTGQVLVIDGGFLA
jgi:3-oxoacyl-[acyl-carrier protein] reductase